MTVASRPVVHSRSVERLVRGRPTSDGAGVKLTRVLTQDLQRRLDPFLMLDAFGSDAASDYIGGFPDHPHRGFETVTIMLAGRMRHRDSVGNVGLLEPGSVQWMTAGRGIIHSEMPEQEAGRMAGFQLWVNLPAKDKMTAPAYRDIAPADVPVLELAQRRARARDRRGRAMARRARCSGRPPNRSASTSCCRPGPRSTPNCRQGTTPSSTCTAARSRSASRLRRSGSRRERMAILANAADRDGVRLVADANATEPARVLLVAGRPLGEPIAQYGPFVMNTSEQLQQAFADFQRGALAG